MADCLMLGVLCFGAPILFDLVSHVNNLSALDPDIECGYFNHQILFSIN